MHRGEQPRTTKAARERLRRAMQRNDATSEQVAQEFALRWGYRPRQAWRHVRGWTQEEVAARYNRLIGDPDSPMTGKRISDFENWPMGGVKPTLNTLFVLAQVYSTEPQCLVDFADREAMTRPERTALQVQDLLPVLNRDRVARSSPVADLRSGGPPSDHETSMDPVDPATDIFPGKPKNGGSVSDATFEECSAYMTCFLEILERDSFYPHEIEELLAVLNRVIRSFVCTESGWLDVMVPVLSVEPGSATPLIDGVASERGWLTLLYSGVRRTSKATTVPIEVNGTPWRGSGNAFVSRGMDYVGSFRGLYAGPEYDLPPDILVKIENKYEYWRRECYFAALLAVAILAPDRSSAQPIGVLNVNFGRENPMGTNDTLRPQQSITILNILEPALRLLATAIDRHSERKRG